MASVELLLRGWARRRSPAALPERARGRNQPPNDARSTPRSRSSSQRARRRPRRPGRARARAFEERSGRRPLPRYSSRYVESPRGSKRVRCSNTVDADAAGRGRTDTPLASPSSRPRHPRPRDRACPLSSRTISLPRPSRSGRRSWSRSEPRSWATSWLASRRLRERRRANDVAHRLGAVLVERSEIAGAVAAFHTPRIAEGRRHQVARRLYERIRKSPLRPRSDTTHRSPRMGARPRSSPALSRVEAASTPEERRDALLLCRRRRTLRRSRRRLRRRCVRSRGPGRPGGARGAARP